MSLEFNIRRTFICFSAVILIVLVCSGYDFNQEYTAVYFNPWAKHPYTDGTRAPYADNYTVHEIEVMLEIIRKKFSRVITRGSGAYNVSYKPSFTYHYKSDVGVYISETAAKVNRLRETKSVRILQGITYHDYNPWMETEVKLAVECAERANKIFPGTVEGFIFTHGISKTQFKQAKDTLHYLKELRNSSVSHLKFGTVMVASLLYDFCRSRLSEKEMQIVQDILQESDFVTCDIGAPDMIKKKGAEIAFEGVSKQLLDTRDRLRQNFTASKLEFIGAIGWNSKGYNKWETIQNMKDYWELADQWATKHRFPIHFLQAFDTPYDAVTPSRGWWRLIENSKSGEKAGYAQKILELKEETLTTIYNTFSTVTEKILNSSEASNEAAKSTENLVLISVGSLSIILVLTLIAVLFFRMERLKQKLSKEDIQQFMHGTTAKHSEYDRNSQLQVAYETSFEIQKDQLEIQHNKILGTGQFACVFEAAIKFPNEERKQVALKMAKDGCSRSTLMGFLTEIKILMLIGKHQNIVALEGAYTAELHNNIVYIATELCSLGSLKEYLRQNKKLTPFTSNEAIAFGETQTNQTIYYNTSGCVDVPQMIQWSKEIASGMEYLGAKNVVHSDLAARNVLLTEEKIAKITDFGLSRRMYDCSKLTNKETGPRPFRWMAIESLKLFEFSFKSDVWGYGVTLWEIFTMGDTPYPVHISTADFLNMLENGLRLGRPNHASEELYQIMTECWHSQPSERPSFSAIQHMIKKLVSNQNTTKNKLEHQHRNEILMEETSF